VIDWLKKSCIKKKRVVDERITRGDVSDRIVLIVYADLQGAPGQREKEKKRRGVHKRRRGG
jgi:hypothetical protein